jgi:hypothetical protein
MNWEAIGAIGEVVGALAVVASLIYLASQMRQNNKLLVLEANKFGVEQVMVMSDLILNDQSLIDLMLKPRDQLDKSEKTRLSVLGRRTIISIQQNYNNVTARDSIDSLATIMCEVYHREDINYGMPDVWPEYQKVLPPDFVNWFQVNIATSRN